MTEQIPDAAEALADLRALTSGPWREHPDFLELVRSLIDEGAPFLEIDCVTATGADSRVVRYKLADRLKAFMAARIARNADADVVKRGGSHVLVPSVQI